VIDAETELSHKNINVSATGQFSGGQARTDHEGNFTITDLIAGEYFLNAWPEFYREEDYPGMVVVSAGPDTRGIDLDILFRDRPEEGIFSGQIPDARALEPVPMER